MSSGSPGSTEEDGTGHQVSTAENSAVRMIGQCDRHHTPAHALPAGRRHHRRCTQLVQYVVADSHVGRRDQFGSHGHCLHRTTDSASATSHLKLHTLLVPPPRGRIPRARTVLLLAPTTRLIMVPAPRHESSLPPRCLVGTHRRADGRGARGWPGALIFGDTFAGTSWVSPTRDRYPEKGSPR